MATQPLDFAGYVFGVETGGKVTDYPDYALAVEALRFRRLDGRKHELKMQARYTTPWMDAKEPADASGEPIEDRSPNDA